MDMWCTCYANVFFSPIEQINTAQYNQEKHMIFVNAMSCLDHTSFTREEAHSMSQDYWKVLKHDKEHINQIIEGAPLHLKLPNDQASSGDGFSGNLKDRWTILELGLRWGRKGRKSNSQLKHLMLM